MPAGRRASGRDDGMIYITGDTHGEFGRIEAFCRRFGTCKEDVMIILGDAGINYSGGIRDMRKKEFLESLPITVFAIHGNHEQRPQAIVMGGAYSIDKMVRLMYGYGWWPDEQPSDEVKRYVESRLDKLGWKVDVVLSHTTPLKYEPVEVFMAGVDQSKVDKSTEEWLDGIEDRLDYGKWYCGHYHTEKKVDRVEIMFENFGVVSNNEKYII